MADQTSGGVPHVVQSMFSRPSAVVLLRVEEELVEGWDVGLEIGSRRKGRLGVEGHS